MTRATGPDPAAFVAAKEKIVERRREVEQKHVVVQGEVVHPSGRTTR
jgi:hypothetical protein